MLSIPFNNVKPKLHKIRITRQLLDKPKFRSIGDPVVKTIKKKQFMKSNVRQRRFRF
jgi:hypothetical protein